MTATKTDHSTRQHQHLIEIAATPEEVWKAITEAEELVRWFPLQSEVVAGEGGHITYSWGELAGTCSILNWQPELHLRTSWMQAPGPEATHSALAVDWFLEGSGGQTRLRLVHSGFGMGKEWDDEFNGTDLGWEFELYSLKHYLENHRGSPRRSMWILEDVSAISRQNWDHFLQGVWPGYKLSKPEVGADLQLSLSTGDSIQGQLVSWAPPKQLAMTADNWNRGLFRMAIENCGSGPQAQIWVSLWDFAESEAAALEERLSAALKSAVGG